MRGARFRLRLGPPGLGSALSRARPHSPEVGRGGSNHEPRCIGVHEHPLLGPDDRCRGDRDRGNGEERDGRAPPRRNGDAVSVGLELNGDLGGAGSRLAVWPHLHWKATRHLRVQVGGGPALKAAGSTVVAGARLVWER
jgi:hypothetical protein